MTPVPSIAKVYVLRYWITVEDSLMGVDFSIVLPGEFYALTQKLRLNDRLFLQAWDCGAPTGRARLVKIIGIQMLPTTPQTVHAPEVTLHVQQTWGWGSNATPESTKALSWTCEPDEFPVFGRPGHKAVEARVVTAPEARTPEIIVVGSGHFSRSDAEIVANPSPMPKWVSAMPAVPAPAAPAPAPAAPAAPSSPARSSSRPSSPTTPS